MNAITKLTGAEPTMSSREIAELVGSRHDKVKQSIERLAERKVIRLPPLGVSEKINNLGLPQQVSEYLFEGSDGKRDSIVVVAQLSPEFTARLVDRWQELEAQTMPAIPAGLPDFTNPAVAAMAWAEQFQAKEVATKQAEALEHKVAEDAPKVDFFDKVTVAPGAITLAEAAKILGTGRTRFSAWLRQIAWLRRNNEPYQDKIEAGLLDVKLSSWDHPDFGVQRSVTALVTGKGLTRLQALHSRASQRAVAA